MLDDNTQAINGIEDDEDLDEYYEEMPRRNTPEEDAMVTLASVIGEGALSWFLLDDEADETDEDTRRELELQLYEVSAYILEAMDFTVEEYVSDEEFVIRVKVPDNLQEFLEGAVLERFRVSPSQPLGVRA